MEGKPKLKEGPLNEIPEFYKSIADSPSIGRLQSLSIRVDVPYIVEFIQGINYSESFDVEFTNKFKQIPLVVGLYETTELGSDKTRPILPNNQNLVVYTDRVTIGTASFPAKIGGKYKLRVYNLDI